MYLQDISRNVAVCHYSYRSQANKNCSFGTWDQKNKEHKTGRCDAAGYTFLYAVRSYEKKLTGHSH